MTVQTGGLLRFSGFGNSAAGTMVDSGDGLIQLYGLRNTISGSLAISGVASLQVGSGDVIAADISASQFGGVKITGSGNQMLGSILLDDGRQMTISGSGNAISGHLTDAGGCDQGISDALYIAGGSLTLDNNVVVDGNVVGWQKGRVDIVGSGNGIIGSILLNDGGSLDISGSRNFIGGDVIVSKGVGSPGYTSVSRGVSVSGSSNTIAGGLLVKAGSLTISGTDASLAVYGPMTFGSSSGIGDLTVQQGGFHREWSGHTRDRIRFCRGRGHPESARSDVP